ncbi:MAG: extracellular solute-binding protein [Treponema sp.]|nr:extracellular solute-binding protein [Treponema sp.]
MKKMTLLTTVALCILSLVSCKKNDGKTLYFFNWTYYTPDSVIRDFEQEFGVTVKLDNYASNEEMFAKLKAGATGYDLVVPSQDYVSIMIKEGMFREIDHSKLTNKGNISDAILAKATYDPEMKFSVPYYMGAAGIAVNKSKVTEFERSWSIFGDKTFNQRMCMLDDMREVIGDALAYLGKSVNSLNTDDLAAAQNLIINEWKPNLVKFDAEGFGKSFAAGDFWIVQGYAEVVYAEVPEEKWHDIEFFIPQEGGPCYIDSLCILKDAKNYDLAMEFINYIHRPEVYAKFLDYFHFPPFVNTKAAEFMEKKPHYTADQMANCEVKEDLGSGLEKYDELWQKIRFTE